MALACRDCAKEEDLPYFHIQAEAVPLNSPSTSAAELEVITCCCILSSSPAALDATTSACKWVLAANATSTFGVLLPSLQDTYQDGSSQDEAAQQQHSSDAAAGVRSVLQQNEAERRQQQRRKRKREAAAAAAREASELPGSAGTAAARGSSIGSRPTLARQHSPNDRTLQAAVSSRVAGAAGSRSASGQVGGRRPPIAALPCLAAIDRPRDRRVVALRHSQSLHTNAALTYALSDVAHCSHNLSCKQCGDEVSFQQRASFVLQTRAQC